VFRIKPLDSSSKHIRWLLVLIVLLNCASYSSAQEKKVKKESDLILALKSTDHNPKRATIYSAIIPGWGQAYNKKYWKVPIVWAGLGAVGYYIYDSQNQYNTFKEYYIFLSENPDATIDSGNPARPWTSGDLNTILNNINTSRKNRDLSVIILFAVWGLNLVDANVDGHFFNFDIDEDLGFKWGPASWDLGSNHRALGFNMVFNLY
jgi:hypothetical protein